MKILLTGGAGFIGSHIAEAYLKKGHQVVVLDNLSTGFRKNIPAKARLYAGDIADEAFVQKVFAKEKPDIVNHHAALAEVTRSMREPLNTFRTNVLGTVNMLASFQKYSPSRKKFIFASTGGALYGNPRKIPASETTPIRPVSAYALSKHMAEEAIRFYAGEFGLEYLILRYANVYGPRQNPKGEAGVVAIFGGLLKEGRQPVIFGDGSKTRDYVHVEDIVRANILGLGAGKRGEINLGRGREISDRKVFDEIAAFYGYKGKPIFGAYRPGEVRRITLDSKKAWSLLKWKPKIRFEAGVKKTLSS